MENASRALSIAGGVLVSLLVISLFVFGFSRLSSYKKIQSQVETTEQIAEFNKQFEAYNSKVVTGYKMVTLAHMAQDINTRYAEDNGFKKIEIYISLQNKNGSLPGSVHSNKNSYNLLEYINTYDTLSSDGQREFKELYFQCDRVDYDTKSARVYKMTFSEITKITNK